jgi:fructokinase
MEKITDITIGIELGGTNLKLAIVDLPYQTTLDKLDLKDSNKVKIFNFKTTSNPEETVGLITNEIEKRRQNTEIKIHAVGISAFGPVSISKSSEKYGFILNTPKKGWKFFDLVGFISKELKISKDIISIETDVNAAALLEYQYGNHVSSNNTLFKSLAYITIGTGCGIGIVADNKLIHGLLHPEGGHISVKRHPKDNFEGVCSFHKDCAEGLITNVSLKERKQLSSVDDVVNLTDDDEVWDIISYYIAQVCLNLLYIVSTERIIIGGGIINRECLLPKIRKALFELNNNYLSLPELSEDGLEKFVVRTNFKNDSGILSALSLTLHE